MEQTAKTVSTANAHHSSCGEWETNIDVSSSVWLIYHGSDDRWGCK